MFLKTLSEIFKKMLHLIAIFEWYILLILIRKYSIITQPAEYWDTTEYSTEYSVFGLPLSNMHRVVKREVEGFVIGVFYQQYYSQKLFTTHFTTL